MLPYVGFPKDQLTLIQMTSFHGLWPPCSVLHQPGSKHVEDSSTMSAPMQMASRQWSSSDLDRGVSASATISGIDLNKLSMDELQHMLKEILSGWSHVCFLNLVECTI